MPAKWNLDPKDVGGSGSSAKSKHRGAKGHWQVVMRSLSYTLTHIPTGVSVIGTIPPGHHSKTEMRRLREKLHECLFVELEAKVAKYLRIPGR